MKSVVYIGLRGQDGHVRVIIDGIKDSKGLYVELGPLAAEDPPFDWGHAGPSASLLSVALLIDFLGDEAAARRVAPLFLQEVVSKFRPGEFVLTDWMIKEFFIIQSVLSQHEDLKAVVKAIESY